MEISSVTEASGGNYTCVARNNLGTRNQTFVVDVDEIGTNYGLVVGVPFLVFVLAIGGSYVYFIFIKKEQVKGRG